MRLTDLADHLRAAGCVVVEQPGWRSRGSAFPSRPDTILVHHTGTSAKAKGDLPTLRLLVEGRSDLPGPLCQLALSRSGVVHLIASGKANHAGRGAWLGQTSSSRTIGVEAEHDGRSPWPAAQYEAYLLLCRALVVYLNVTPERVCGHKEWALPAGRKVDPTFDMAMFRRQLGIPQEDDMPLSDEDVERIAEAVYAKTNGDAIAILRGPTHPSLTRILALLTKIALKLEVKP